MHAAILVKVGFLGAAVASGCAVIADLDHTYELTGGSGGPGGAGGGGAGGSGAGGGGVCKPGELRPCYTGPMGTQNVGACKGGLEECDASGSGWGACVGEVVPAPETCMTPLDDDCDMMANEEGEGCACTPGDTLPCYSGPAGTENNLPCKAGTQMCNETGVGYGACMGEIPPTVEDCSTAADEDCDASEVSGGVDVDSGCLCNPGMVGALCPGETQWSKRGGDGGSQEAADVAVDASGNILLVGWFEGSIDLGGGTHTSDSGSRDIFVAKFGPTGTHLWSKRYGSLGLDSPTSVAVTAAGEIVVVGAFDSPSIDFGGGPKSNGGGTDAFVVKLDANGAHLWSIVYGPNSQQQATSVAVAPGGDVYVCGSFSGPAEFGTGSFLPNGGVLDYYLLRMAGADGATVWAKSYGDGANQFDCSVAVDSGSNPILAVPLVGSVNFGGGPLGAQGTDVGVAKLNANGGHVWSKRFGDGAYQDARGVAVDSLDRVLVTGQFQGSVDFGGGALAANGTDAYVARFTSAGAYDLQKAIGGADIQHGVDVGVGENNSIVVVGDFDNAIDFGAPSMPVNAGSDEAFVVKYDAAGAYVWSRAITGVGTQQPVAVATTTAGNVALAGWFSTGIDFGGAGNQHNSMGGADVFVALLQK